MSDVLKRFIRTVLRESFDIWGDNEPLQHRRIDGSTKQHNLHNRAHRMPEERIKIMMKNDVSEEAAIKADKLLDAHGIDSNGPDQEILKHVDANDEIGVALKRHVEMETGAFLKFKSQLDARRKHFDDEVQKLKRKWDNPPNSDWRNLELWANGLDQYNSNMEVQDIVNKLEEEFEEENKPFYVYRKSASNDPTRRILSWTTHSTGAWLGHGQGRMTPDKKKTIDEMLDDGWMILGGIVRMMGSSGEGEITFIKL